jgi:hypothetical protein
MINLSEKIADSYRKGHEAKANPANPVTSRRRKLYSVIKDRTGGDPSAELEYAMKIIAKERPKIEDYVISKNEVPMDKLSDLVMQAYTLRCREIDHTAKTLGVSEGEGNIFLEDDEAEEKLANDANAENFVGELFAPIGIAATHLNGSPDNLDSSLVTGILNTVGGMFDKGALRRAAQNKPAGITGTLAGGSKQYNLLRSYLQNPANADERDLILKGAITDTSQLRGYNQDAGNLGSTGGIKVLGKDVINEIAKQKKKEELKKAMPFIIMGVVILILIIFLIVKSVKRK